VPRTDLTPQSKAANTDRWTEILFKALSARAAQRWTFVSLRGLGGGEWRGIVDILAIRKDTRVSKHDLLKSGDRCGSPARDRAIAGASGYRCP
jgi:hypothetical protein